MQSKKMFTNPSLKWIGLMPCIAIVMLLAALVFALLVPTQPYDSNSNFYVCHHRVRRCARRGRGSNFEHKKKSLRAGPIR